MREQDRAAAERVAERAAVRRDRIDKLRQRGGLARADDPIRVANRLDRLSRYHSDIRPIDPAAIVAEDPAAMSAAGTVLERVILTNDFLAVRYLEAGAIASRAVGRVDIRDERGRLVGYGTGSLVSPVLLLTNHHVLPNAEVAAASVVEFDYQEGMDGRPLQPRAFELDPKRFFVADETLDIALVAVAGSPGDLSWFGFNRLIEAEGKAIVGDFVTIVQHPRGERKQVALRENRVVDVLDLFLHYMTDTEPGSSGSPVFNDQWEVVALHHAGVPAPDHSELGGIVNEGVRVSRLVKFLREHSLAPSQRALVDGLFAQAAATAVNAPVQPPIALPPIAPPSTVPSAPPVERATQMVVATVPLEIRVHLGGAKPALQTVEPATEAIEIDRNYANRVGYDSDFLGTGVHRVPLPTLPDDLVELAATNSMATGEPRYVLPYHHFSVVLNKRRRLAFFTAVNIDGNESFRIKRERDSWSFDPRIPRDEQAGEEVYADNPLDRGHLVRRLDPAWGLTRSIAKIGNDDTFHFTNCTPQHKDFNENQTTWAGLEDYILDNADNLNFKVGVFTGPILADDDQPYKGVRLPRQFWKVVVMVKTGGELSATAYLLSQEDLIRGVEVALEDFSYGAYRTYQVPVRRIEALTRLSFSALRDADPMERLEDMAAFREISRFEQMLV